MTLARYARAPARGYRPRAVRADYAATAPFTDQTVTALPVTVNLTFYEGDDFLLDVTVTDPSGGAINLSDAEVLSQIRRTPDAEDVEAEFTGYGEGNVIHLHMPATENQNMPTTAVWDCQITWLGRITTLVAGQVTIVQEVSRP